MRFHLLAILAIALLVGCTPSDAVREAKDARDRVAVAVEPAYATANTLIDLAEKVGGIEAEALRAKAEAIKAQADAALAKADALIEKAETIAAESGDSWIDFLLGLGATVIPSLEIIRRMRARTNALTDAVRAATNHADRMEAAETDGDVRAAKALSISEQEALRVRGLIEGIRA